MTKQHIQTTATTAPYAAIALAQLRGASSSVGLMGELQSCELLGSDQDNSFKQDHRPRPGFSGGSH